MKYYQKFAFKRASRIKWKCQILANGSFGNFLLKSVLGLLTFSTTSTTNLFQLNLKLHAPYRPSSSKPLEPNCCVWHTGAGLDLYQILTCRGTMAGGAMVGYAVFGSKSIQKGRSAARVPEGPFTPA